MSAALLLASNVGCTLFEGEGRPLGQSPLHKAEASPDAATIEIFWARFPHDAAAFNEELWSEVQEDRLSPELRSRLAQQGLRAGVVSGTPPAALMELLNPEGRNFDEQSLHEPIEPASLAETPKVTRRVKQLRFGARMELQASEVIESAALLVPQDGELGGGTYQLAQAVYQLELHHRPNRQIELHITPELQHGPQRTRWSQDDTGILRLAPGRDAKAFRELVMAVPLSPGEIFVVCGLPATSGRLGHYFHTVETPTGRQQKAVLIRLAEAPQDATFQIDEDRATRW